MQLAGVLFSRCGIGLVARAEATLASCRLVNAHAGAERRRSRLAPSPLVRPVSRQQTTRPTKQGQCQYPPLSTPESPCACCSPTRIMRI